ncbi:MAG: hypothetical protein QY322_04110 [bacterium]|nr:MAG: hypothetical protein QY322_04110 [bacterium]
MNEESNFSSNKSNFLIVVVLLVFLLTLGILVYYIRFQTTIAPRADNYNSIQSVSIVNSYVFASPVRAKASGDLIRVTTFALDDNGSGLYDKRVELKSDNSGLAIKEIQSLTDETGKALFDLSSDIIGTYTVDVYVDGVKLPQSLRVVFD